MHLQMLSILGVISRYKIKMFSVIWLIQTRSKWTWNVGQLNREFIASYIILFLLDFQLICQSKWRDFGCLSIQTIDPRSKYFTYQSFFNFFWNFLLIFNQNTNPSWIFEHKKLYR